MNAEDTAIILRSWRRLAPASGMLGHVFYGRLFMIAPNVQPLFAEDVTRQAGKLMETLSTIVNALETEDLEKAEQDLRALGARHRAYGARPEHYIAVADALVWTFDNAVPGGLSAAERRAWLKAYAKVYEAMRRGEFEAAVTSADPTFTAASHRREAGEA